MGESQNHLLSAVLTHQFGQRQENLQFRQDIFVSPSPFIKDLGDLLAGYGESNLSSTIQVLAQLAFEARYPRRVSDDHVGSLLPWAPKEPHAPGPQCLASQNCFR